RQWRLSVAQLPQLTASSLFAPSVMRYDFDREAVLEQVKEQQLQMEEAAKRVQADPFEVAESDLDLLDLELVFRAAKYGQGLLAYLKYGSKHKKLLEAVKGVHYIRSERAYFFPTPALADFLRVLKTKKVKFGVEAKAGSQLKRSAALRAAILKAQKKPTGHELLETFLTPYIDCLPEDEGGRRFKLYAWTTQQLRICFPDIKSFSEKKAKASAMDWEQLLKLLYQVQKSDTKVWLTAEVQDLLQARSADSLAKIIKAEEEGFDDELLALNRPPACWCCGPDGSGGLLVERNFYATLKAQLPRKIVKQAKCIKHPQFWECEFLAWPDSKLMDVFESLRTLAPPRSRAFAELLADLKERRLLLERRAYFQGLRDSRPQLTNLELEAKLFPHQRVAVSWLLETKRAFLGDDMGLGKTLSVLAAFDELKSRGEVEFLLVVCPNSLVRSWLREAGQWLPGQWFGMLPEEKAPRQRELARLNRFGIATLCGLVVNYETFRLEYVFPELQKLCKDRKTLLCLDESQRVKNPQSRSFQALREVATVCPRRVLLSGTPTPKDLSDIWAQISILDDGRRFGRNYFHWLERVAELGNKWSEFAVKRFIPEQVEETISRVHELLLRRRKEDVIDLPEKVFSIRDVELKGDQKKLYDEVRSGLLRRISATDGHEFIKEIDSILEEYLRAVQVASNPRLINPEWSGDPAKFVELDEIVREIVGEREGKIVVWTNYILNVTDLVARYKTYGAAGFYGEVKAEKRSELIADFQSQRSGSIKVLVAVPAAGGVGITLTAAQTAVYLDKTWNAEHWMQSVDRVHRIGQQGTVNIISLNASKVDELIHW
ncbi:MAG: DEAD/DEAH box helicase, partial [Deltaproteobacteria bacterium]|nr:DEAD/DEAH box helicase [Deltaproteobacteria bacterium]